MKTLLLCTAALGCAGCAAAPGRGADVAEARYAYLPVPELADAFAEASARIEAASGVELYVDDDIGTRIELAEDLGGFCGKTITLYRRPATVISVTIQVAHPAPNGCGAFGVVVLHELIHSLRREADLYKEGHTESGIFQLKGGNQKIDEASLDKICEVADCTRFNPEE